MDPVHIASTSKHEDKVQNVGESASNRPHGNTFKRIGVVVKNLAPVMGLPKRIQGGNQLAAQNQNRSLTAYPNTVARAIEVLIGSNTASSPQSMLLSPADIHSTVIAFGGYLGNGPALSRLHLAIQQPNRPHTPLTLAELHSGLTSLGNNSPERVQEIARASLSHLVKNISNKRVPFFTPVYTKKLKNLGSSALLLLNTLNEAPADGAIATYTDLSDEGLKRLLRMLHDFVKTLPVDTQPHLEALKFAQHIEGKITEIKDFHILMARRVYLGPLPEKCSNDIDVMKNVVKFNGLFLRFASPELLNNLDLVMVAVQRHGAALQLASDDIKKIKSVVMAAVQQDGCALRWASDEFKDDDEVVTAAVKSWGRALTYASEVLKDNRNVVMAAVQKDPWALQCASPRLRSSREVVMAAVQRAGLSISLASRELRNDPEVFAAATKAFGRPFVLLDSQSPHDF